MKKAAKKLKADVEAARKRIGKERDYLRDLIRHDREEIERLLLEGVESGKAMPLNMAALQKKAKALLKREQGK